ncbi:MAG: hypothetical protein ACETWM_11655 [Candidatus Lokiarchaeia archaeon]
MPDFIKRNKKVLIIACVIFLCIMLGVMLYNYVGHKLIDVVYEGESIGFLNKIIEGQSMHPLEHYLGIADLLFYRILLFGACLLFFFCIFLFKSTHARIEFAIIILAIGIGVMSQLPSFLNRYIINDDVMQHVYWMQQFRDGGLFKNDLLTVYAKNYQPWGFIALYYVFSFIIDPMIISKIIPIVLFVVSSLYLFKLVSEMTNNYTGFLSASIFMAAPIYLDRMVGGLPRAFGYPLLIIFLYYLIKKEYLKSSLVLILQCLFYPIVFLLSMLTYLFAFIKMQHKKIFFDKPVTKTKYFIIAIIICSFILCGKYVISYNPSIGKVVTKEQMVGNPEYYYSKGRFNLLPTPPVLQSIKQYLKKGMVFSQIFDKPTKMVSINPGGLNSEIIFLIILLFLALEIKRKKLLLPIEIILLFLSAILMHIISVLFLFRLAFPSRYLMYSLPLITLIICTIAIGQLVIKIKSARIKRTFQILILILVFLNIDHQYSVGLINMSDKKDLYNYLNSLPKKTMIVAHPGLADGIPTFAQRKVFIKYELSHPVFDNYWKTIKKRTVDFFNAYYSENTLLIYDFCKQNGIDYFIVDKKHFTEKYLNHGRIYFEPFNTYVKNITEKRKNFVLDNIPEEDKLFVANDIFVIKKDVLNVNSFKDEK